ncbi:hypothetical protein [Methylomonas sp. HYX-M1]|uniref:hypothetical protein n=1 Tax=Methylomonas sp. HYX-M1 TaxID=3139307 RepID=UPI00345BE1A8
MKHNFKVIQKTKIAGLAVIMASSVFLSETASATLISGNATITLNGTWDSGFLRSGYYPTTFFDASFNTTALDASTTGGSEITGGSGTFVSSINTNSTKINYGAAGTLQATTMDTSDSNVGQIGLSGAFRLTTVDGPSPYLTPQDWYLKKVGGTWNLVDNNPGFGQQTFAQLVNVVDNLASAGTLVGDLQLLPDATNIVGFTWGRFFGADATQKTTTFGTLSIAPATVPVPAAIWLFASGLFGLIGATRKKQST